MCQYAIVHTLVDAARSAFSHVTCADVAVVVTNGGQEAIFLMVVAALGEGIGHATNNQAEYRAALAPEMAKLPEREQKIVYLRFYKGLTQSEIATRLGISQMHVSRLLTRTLAQLREALEES